MSSIEKLTCRKVPNVLKYHVPNKQTNTHRHTDTDTDTHTHAHTHTHTHTHRHTEEHALQMLFIYFPFRDENELKYSDS